MMTNKYYTPKLSEFHHGFEYEVLQKGTPYDRNALYFMPPETEDKWHKYTYPDPFYGYNLKALLERQTIRVEYLSKQDLEDCGFELINKTNFVNYFTHKSGARLALPTSQATLLSIFHGGQITVENISIKNKSEFKKLLKQLGI